MRFLANISFDADNDAAARGLIESWGLPEGSVVTAQASPDTVTAVIGADGTLTPPEPPEPPT